MSIYSLTINSYRKRKHINSEKEMQDICLMLQQIFTNEFIIILLILIAFSDKATSALKALSDFIRGRSSETQRIKRFQDKSKKAEEILEFYRCRFSADRISFFTFHNGGHDFTGIPFYRFSCVNELVARGIPSVIAEAQGLHLCMIVDWTDHFLQNEAFSVRCSECKHCNNHTIKALLESRGTKAGILSPVWNGKSLAGFLLVEWLDENVDNQIIQAALSDMLELSKTIEIERFR